MGMVSVVVASVAMLVTAPTGERVEIDRELLALMRRFPTVCGCAWDKHDFDSERYAKTLLARLGADHDPLTGKILRYYEADCHFVLGELGKAESLANQVLEDEPSFNRAEATRLLCKISSFKALKALDREKSNVAYPTWGIAFKYMLTSKFAIAKLFPRGRHADSVMLADEACHKPVLVGGKLLGRIKMGGFFLPKSDPRKMYNAGLLYAEMGMAPQSIRAYQLAVGLTIASEWISPNTIGLWTAQGDAQARLGQWTKALACYYKAVASGGRLDELLPRLQHVASGISEAPKIEPLNPKPDADKLRKIATRCMGTYQFDEALRAAEAVKAATGKVDHQLLNDIYSQKADVLEKALFIYDGAMFRGTIISQPNIDAARQRAEYHLLRAPAGE